MINEYRYAACAAATTFQAAQARVCALTYFCTDTGVHPTPTGHEAIAEAVLAAVGYCFGWFAAYSARFHSAK